MYTLLEVYGFSRLQNAEFQYALSELLTSVFRFHMDLFSSPRKPVEKSFDARSAVGIAFLDVRSELEILTLEGSEGVDCKLISALRLSK